MNPVSPCIDCNDRFVLCHSKCSKYIEFRKMLDEKNEFIRKSRRDDNFRIFYYKKNNKR